MSGAPGTPPATGAAPTVLTAVSAMATMGLGAVVAVLVLLLFGTSAQTDAFFLAYGAYSLLVALGQGLRIGLVARLAGDEAWAALDRVVWAAVGLGLLSAVPLVALGGPLARLLGGALDPSAITTTRMSLGLLWGAGALQLLAGSLAAWLSARGRHTAPAVAYVTGALTSIVALPLLAPALSVVAVAVAVLLGAGVVAVQVVVHTVRLGWRPSWTSTSWRVLGQVVSGALGHLMMQLAYLVTMACASRLGPSQATLYSYGFFAALLLVGATATPAATVLAGPLARTWDGRPRSLDAQLVGVTRLAASLAALPLLVMAVVGVHLLTSLPLGLSRGDASSIVAVVVSLSGFVVATAAAAVPTIACTAQGRYGVLAAVAAGSLVVHTVLSVAALRLDGLVPLALTATTTAVVTLVGLVVVVYGAEWRRPLAGLALAVTGVAATAVLAFSPALAVVGLGRTTTGTAVGLAVLGCLAYATLVRWLLPGTWVVAQRLAGRTA